MWRRNAWAVVSLLCLSQPAWLSEVALGGEQVPPAPSLVARIKWLQFEVLLGRVTVISSRMGQSRFASGDEQSGEIHEALTVSGDSQFADLRYERSEPGRRQILVEHNSAATTRITIQPIRSEQGPHVQFVQSPRGLVTFSIGTVPHERQYTANSLWHLLVREPALCREHLIPVLELLRPNWKLMETAERIEAALFESVQGSVPASREQLRRLIADLAHPQFQRRQSADRELRAHGLAVLPLLDQFRPADLTAEQRVRIQQIRDSFGLQTGDTPDRVASWLIDDRAIWVTLLAHRETQKRLTAARYLTDVCGTPVGFDVLSDEEARRQQIDKLLEQTTRDLFAEK